MFFWDQPQVSLIWLVGWTYFWPISYRRKYLKSGAQDFNTYLLNMKWHKKLVSIFYKLPCDMTKNRIIPPLWWSELIQTQSDIIPYTSTSVSEKIFHLCFDSFKENISDKIKYTSEISVSKHSLRSWNISNYFFTQIPLH